VVRISVSYSIRTISDSPGARCVGNPYNYRDAKPASGTDLFKKKG
jgi:hypothetical protein